MAKKTPDYKRLCDMLRDVVTDSPMPPNNPQQLSPPETIRWVTEFMRKNGIMAPKSTVMRSLVELANRLEDAAEEVEKEYSK